MKYEYKTINIHIDLKEKISFVSLVCNFHISFCRYDSHKTNQMQNGSLVKLTLIQNL